MATISPIGNRETVADGLTNLATEQKDWLSLLMDNPANDDVFLAGLELYLDHATQARFLNSLKLQTTGEWLGNAAPARLQMRVTEAARSGQHPAYEAFRLGLLRSGGLERAYPKANI